MKKTIAMVLVGVVGLVAAGCGAAPSESTESGEQAYTRINPYNQWNCSIIAGVPGSPLGYDVALSLGAAPADPPNTVYSEFYGVVSTAIGYQPFERLSASYTTQWHSIEMTTMTSAQQASLESIVNNPPWEGNNQACNPLTNKGGCIQPGVYWCVFDYGDCVDMGGKPSECRGPSRMILAYDPRGCNGCM
jgi:hypothetical protein